MGGRGSGGRRAGAGRKPKDARLLAITGGLSRRPGASAVVPDLTTDLRTPAAVVHAAVAPPVDLEPDELAIWERDAPLAIAQGTLTAAMAGAFRAYCELEALTAAMHKRIKKDLVLVVSSESGDFEKPNPLLPQYRGAVQRLQSMRKDFKLSPFGKEEAPARADQPATPGSRLSAFASRRA